MLRSITPLAFQTSPRLPFCLLSKIQRAVATQRCVKPPFSSFRTPTSRWIDSIRTEFYARWQQQRRSPFIQERYRRFVQEHPELHHSGLVYHHFAPFPAPTKRAATPATSYLRCRLQLRNTPHTAARRNALLRARCGSDRGPLVAILRTRRHYKRPVRLHTLEDPVTRFRMAWLHRFNVPKRACVQSSPRFSRRRQL